MIWNNCVTIWMELVFLGGQVDRVNHWAMFWFRLQMFRFLVRRRLHTYDVHPQIATKPYPGIHPICRHREDVVDV